MTPRASAELLELSNKSMGASLFLLVDNKPLGLSKIQSPIEDGNLYFSLELSEEELPQLVSDLRSTTGLFFNKRKI